MLLLMAPASAYQKSIHGLTLSLFRPFYMRAAQVSGTLTSKLDSIMVSLLNMHMGGNTCCVRMSGECQCL